MADSALRARCRCSARPPDVMLAGRRASEACESDDADKSGPFGPALRRLLAAAAAGLVAAGIAVLEGTPWFVAALCATDVAAIVFVTRVWSKVGRADAGTTARLARAEDGSRTAADAVQIGAGSASLLAVGFTLGQAGHAHAPARGLLIALALVSVALAWSSIHTVYALRYARLYYSPPDGGIDFHDDAPNYLDFAYLALTIGMTFQVSDTTLTGKRVRRTALHHALTSYLFGAVMLAIAVNLVAPLLGR